jgi:hypothetical protein
MWTGMADAAYVRVRYAQTDTVDYQFAKGPSNPGELTMPQDAWDRIVIRSADQPLQITLTVKVGGTLSTCETSWEIAPGTLTGSVYYNTYNAPGAMFAGQGAIMRLRLGQPQSEIYLQDPTVKNLIPGTGPCISCHSVSFDGSTLAASRHDYQAKTYAISAYDVTAAAQPAARSAVPNGAYGGLTPDGTRMLAMGSPDCTGGADTFPRAPRNIPFIEGPEIAHVLDTKTGLKLPAAGLNPEHYMWMPQFSPKGDKVVFNHAKPGPGGTDRRELAVMDYDYATNTFSNLKVIVSKLGPEPSMPYAPIGSGAGPLPPGKDMCTLQFGQEAAQINPGTCTGPCYPSWPFFTPDGKGVVFLLTNQPDFASAFPGRDAPSLGELWYTDIQSGASVRLDQANKGPVAADSLTNYYPTVLPVPIGGYFWVFWTAKRTYGNQPFPMPVLSGAPTTIFAEMDAVKKRIWVSALRPVPAGTEFADMADPSHPGFFLTGQSQSGNVRAFTTLNPCVKRGESCESGLDCCGGFCSIPDPTEFETPKGTCTDTPPECSKTNERCTQDSDCCPPAANAPPNLCIAGYCAFLQGPG